MTQLLLASRALHAASARAKAVTAREVQNCSAIKWGCSRAAKDIVTGIGPSLFLFSVIKGTARAPKKSGQLMSVMSPQ